MRVLGTKFVERWRGRMLNIHPSLLPDLRGLHTHERALAAGLKEHGCTVHFVEPELDAGPIVAQARVPVLPDDDARDAGGAGPGRGAQALPARARRSRGEAVAPLRDRLPLANLGRSARRCWRRCGFVTELPDGWGGRRSRSRRGAAARRDGRQEGEKDEVRNGRRRRRAAGPDRIARAVHQPRAVVAGVQPPGAGGIGQPQSSAARAAALPVDLGQQSRRILHGPRRRPGWPGARRHDGDSPTTASPRSSSSNASARGSRNLSPRSRSAGARCAPSSKRRGSSSATSPRSRPATANGWRTISFSTSSRC